MVPVLSTKLLVAQTSLADPSQAWLANVDGLSGVSVNSSAPGVAVVSTEKLGLMTSTHYANWSAGVTEGEVTIETADEPSYTGPWIALQALTFQGSAPKLDSVTIAGTYGAFRHRITIPVVGGSVTTKVTGTT